MFERNKGAKITGLVVLSLWVVLNIILFTGEADISATRVSNWPLFIALTVSSFLAPYLLVIGLQKLVGLLR